MALRLIVITFCLISSLVDGSPLLSLKARKGGGGGGSSSAENTGETSSVLPP